MCGELTCLYVCKYAGLWHIPADICFKALATCSDVLWQAEFTEANTLRLTGVSSTAQFYGAGVRLSHHHLLGVNSGVAPCGQHILWGVLVPVMPECRSHNLLFQDALLPASLCLRLDICYVTCCIVACAGSKAGVLLMPTFVNSSAGATYVATNGQWLDTPDAALIGDVNNSVSNQAVLLSLGNPTYDAATKVLLSSKTILCKGVLACSVNAVHLHSCVLHMQAMPCMFRI